MILTHKTIGTAPPKDEYLDIPGGDGVLDMTEFFGEVKYGNRPITYEFSTAIPYEQFPAFFSRVQNALHGQKVEIVDDEDPSCYYIGRVTVSPFQAKRAIGELAIDCNCEPYKYHLASQTVHLTGRNLINIDAGIITDEGVWTKDATGYTFTRRIGTGGSFVYWSVPVRKGQKYAFSADYTLTTRLLYVYKNRLYGDLVGKQSGGKPVIFTAEENGVYIFGLYVTSAATDGTFANVMLEEGETVGAYVGYDATERTVAAIFHNVRKPTIPVAYANGDVSVESPSTLMALIAGNNTLEGFTFYQGENSLTFKGNGTVVVEWLERGL